MTFIETTVYTIPNTEEGKRFADNMESSFKWGGQTVNRMEDDNNIYLGVCQNRKSEDTIWG
jgi:hypothetical protein